MLLRVDSVAIKVFVIPLRPKFLFFFIGRGRLHGRDDGNQPVPSVSSIDMCQNMFRVWRSLGCSIALSATLYNYFILFLLYKYDKIQCLFSD